MKHLTEEELIASYYGDGDSTTSAHLAACSECAAQFAELKTDLEGVKMTAVPARGADYGERVWQALQPRLVPYEKKMPAWRIFFTAQWRTATACVLLVAVAFVGGRIWERQQKVQVADHAAPQAQRRVVLVVLADHLDRTERLLVSLGHADSGDRLGNAQMQMQARELLAANRLYRSTADHGDDPALAGALDKLQGVLVEVANEPNLTAKDLERVRSEMDTEGILFEIRVLRARGTEEVNETKRQGATI